ncbi:MAG: hypothetical protein QOF89_5552 [Acidobacteriota bacterium]|jgi:hypothetical protein|nr:hypothetical protein [Acidobacteriota bacterium]
MRELVKSGLSFTWAMPLFGMQQLASWLSSDTQRRRRAAVRLDTVTRSAADGFDQEEGWLGWLYQLGQCAQEGLANLGPSLLTPELLAPSTWVSLSAEVAQRSLVTTRLLAEGKGGLALEELRAKGEVFCLVLGVAQLLGAPSEPPFPLGEMLVRAYEQGPFRALWGVEGLGHDYGDSFWEQGIVPHGILREERTGGLPARALTMLNAGIGLSFSQHLLESSRSRTPPDELARIVEEIVRLCRNNARPGYLGAAWESLGLVTRTFYPGLVPNVDQVLRTLAPEVLGYYWHGIGRAIYFVPINFLPGSDGFILDMAACEAPDEPARRNAMAGAAWAFGLVTQRNPEILASLVIEPYGEALTRNEGFANGIAASMMTRYDTTPDAPFIEAFVQYRPSPGNPRLAEMWDRLVRIPAEAALQVYYPVIKEHNRLGDIFEYRDLPAFVASLQGGSGRRGAA